MGIINELLRFYWECYRGYIETCTTNSLHFGSDEGAEIAAVYHTIISMVKLQGRFAWDYLGKFFTGIFNGCRDFLSLTSQNMNLVVCQ